MGIFNVKKKSVSFEEAARPLIVSVFENRHYFLEEILPKIAACLDVDLETYDMDMIGTATFIVCLWASAKAMEPEDKRFLDIVYATTENDALNKIISFRNEKYNDAWDENAGGNQQILAKRILCDVIFNGERDERSDNIQATSLMNTFLFHIMEKNLKAKTEIGLK